MGVRYFSRFSELFDTAFCLGHSLASKANYRGILRLTMWFSSILCLK